MNRTPWLSILAIVGVAAVVALLVMLPRGQRDTAADGTEVTPGAQVQARLQQFSEARARAEPGGSADKVDAPSRAPAVGSRKSADSMGRAHPQPPQGADEVAPGLDQGEMFIDPQPEDIPTLKTMALQDADPQRRLAAVTLLGASEDPEVIPVLAQALSDKDEDVRMAAVQSLADFTGEAPIDAIESALNDQSADVRYEALEVLSDIGGERAHRAVQRALNDPDEDVQELAQSILELDAAEDEHE